MSFEESLKSTGKHDHSSQPSRKISKPAKPYSRKRKQHDELKGCGKRDEDIFWHRRRMARAATKSLQHLIHHAMQTHPKNSQYLCIRVSLKQAIRDTEHGWIDLTRETADQAIKVGCDRVNYGVFGKAAKKGRRRLWMIDCHEGGASKRHHRHLLVHVPIGECPQTLSDTFRDRLSKLDWVKKSHGASQHALKIELAESPSAVMRYITKTGVDSISLETSTL